MLIVHIRNKLRYDSSDHSSQLSNENCSQFETPQLNYKISPSLNENYQNFRSTDKLLNYQGNFNDNLIAHSLDLKYETAKNNSLLGIGALALKNAKLKLSKSTIKDVSKSIIDKNLVAKRIYKLPKNKSDKLFDNYFGK